MVIEQIRQGGMAEQGQDILPDLAAILQPGPEVDNPSTAPACMPSAAGKATLQCDSGGCGQLRRMLQRKLLAGIQAKQMGDMAVAWLLLLIVLHPFQDLTVLSDGWRRKTVQSGRKLQTETLIRTQNGRAFHAGTEQGMNNLKIHGSSDAQHP
ncbi:hypothetical protein D3C75_817290 [compost metagenome]